MWTKGSSSSSERRPGGRTPPERRSRGARSTGRAGWWAAVIALGAAASAGALAPEAAERPAPRFAGEYGLFVRHLEDGIEVRWLTERPVEGVLRAYAGEKRIAAVETPASQSHAATVATDAREIVLEYGAGDEAGSLHRTRLWLDPPSRPTIPAFEAGDSLYIVGDVHGEFDGLARLLYRAGLIDEQHAWTGGRSRLVFLGDLFDRGADVTRLLWFLYRLEREAEAAGGRVHLVLGNHEVMVMTGDLRYVEGKEWMVAFRHGVEYSEMFHPRRTVLGRWLAARPVLMRLDDVLLAHGGVSPAYAGYTLRDVQDSLARFMDEELFLHWHAPDDDEFWAAFAETTELDSAAVARRYDFFFSDESILWYRGLVQSDTLDTHLTRVLERHESSLHVVGHSLVQRIEPRYGGRLIAVDVQPPAAELLLLVRDGKGGWRRLRLPAVGPPAPLPQVAAGPS